MACRNFQANADCSVEEGGEGGFGDERYLGSRGWMEAEEDEDEEEVGSRGKGIHTEILAPQGRGGRRREDIPTQ